jgi:hypothetical protein
LSGLPHQIPFQLLTLQVILRSRYLLEGESDKGSFMEKPQLPIDIVFFSLQHSDAGMLN